MPSQGKHMVNKSMVCPKRANSTSSRLFQTGKEVQGKRVTFHLFHTVLIQITQHSPQPSIWLLHTKRIVWEHQTQNSSTLTPWNQFGVWELSRVLQCSPRNTLLFSCYSVIHLLLVLCWMAPWPAATCSFLRQAQTYRTRSGGF